MKVIHSSKEVIDKLAVKEIVDLINNKPNCVLGLATGSTPLGVYKRLIEEYSYGKVDFKDVVTFNLDEYIGLEPSDVNSYKYFMDNNLFDHININRNNTFIPDGMIDELTNPEYYDKLIDSYNGIDLQILGLGSDGHIGFNEPNTPFDSLTHITSLKDETISDNSRFFSSIDLVPKKAITMGLKTIFGAKRIILMVYGKNKEQAINAFLNNEPDESLPCSILKTHNNLVLYIDENITLK